MSKPIKMPSNRNLQAYIGAGEQKQWNSLTSKLVKIEGNLVILLLLGFGGVGH